MADKDIFMCVGCGELDQLRVFYSNFTRGYHVRCYSCGMAGPVGHGHGDAINKWNSMQTIIPVPQRVWVKCQVGTTVPAVFATKEVMLAPGSPGSGCNYYGPLPVHGVAEQAPEPSLTEMTEDRNKCWRNWQTAEQMLHIREQERNEAIERAAAAEAALEEEKASSSARWLAQVEEQRQRAERAEERALVAEARATRAEAKNAALWVEHDNILSENERLLEASRPYSQAEHARAIAALDKVMTVRRYCVFGGDQGEIVKAKSPSGDWVLFEDLQSALEDD